MYVLQTGSYTYNDVGNYFETLSQIAGEVATVSPLTQSTDIPDQASWLGDLIVSVPNITLQTFAVSAWQLYSKHRACLFACLINSFFRDDCML